MCCASPGSGEGLSRDDEGGGIRAPVGEEEGKGVQEDEAAHRLAQEHVVGASCRAVTIRASVLVNGLW